MNAKIGSISEALQNASSAKSLTQVADSGLSEINSILSRIREIAVQASSTTLTSGDRTSLQTEVDAYLTEVDNITKTIKFNDLILLDGSTSTVSFMIGEDKDSLLSISLKDSDSSALSLSSISGVKEFTSGRVQILQLMRLK